MKNWTNKRSAAKHAAWTGLRRGVRRFCVGCLAVLGATALPVHAFQTTSNADGSFEYFFAEPNTAALVLGGLIAASFAARRRKTPQ